MHRNIWILHIGIATGTQSSLCMKYTVEPLLKTPLFYYAIIMLWYTFTPEITGHSIMQNPKVCPLEGFHCTHDISPGL